ncbi:unnamed protein product [Cunninghamella echinulata]
MEYTEPNQDLVNEIIQGILKLSMASELTYLNTAVKWEAFVESLYESTNDLIYKDPWNEALLTDAFLNRFTFYRLNTMVPIVADKLQVRTLYNDIKFLEHVFKIKGIDWPRNLTRNYLQILYYFLEKGYLNNEGKKRMVLRKHDYIYVLEQFLYFTIVHRNATYSLQVVALSLMFYYTGIRPGSILPASNDLKDSWKALRWRDVELYREKTDMYGDILHAKITFRYIKQHQIISKVDSSFTRDIRSPSDNVHCMDLALILMVLATLRNFAKVDVDNWYMSDDKHFYIKENYLDTPVICNYSSDGESKDYLTEEPWIATLANKGLKKMFKEGGLDSANISSYALRRNFNQITTQVLSSENPNLITGQQPRSMVQHTNYGNMFDNTDITKLVNEGIYEEFDNEDTTVRTLKSFVKPGERRLTRDEYKENIEPYVANELKELNDYQKELEKEHGDTMKKIYNDLDEDTKNTLKNLRKAYIKKQFKLTGIATKEKAERLMKERQDEMEIDRTDNDDDIEIIPANDDDYDEENENEVIMAEDLNFEYDSSTLYSSMLSASTSSSVQLPSTSSSSSVQVHSPILSPSSYNNPGSPSSFQAIPPLSPFDKSYSTSPPLSSSGTRKRPYNLINTTLVAESSTSSLRASSSSTETNPITATNIANTTTTTTTTTSTNKTITKPVPIIPEDREEVISALLSLNEEIQIIVNECHYCENDDSIPADKKYNKRGYQELVKHLVSSFYTTDWLSSNRKVRSFNGTHTVKKRFNRSNYVFDANMTSCNIDGCTREFKPPVREKSYRGHLSHHAKDIQNLTRDEAYEELKNSLLDNYGIIFGRYQFDCMLYKYHGKE